MMRRTFLLAIGLILLGATGAFASIAIDFGTGDVITGTVTQTAGNVTGSGISVDDLIVNINGAISQYDTSGAAIGQGGETAAVLSFNQTSNTLTIVGGVPTLGIADGTTLLSMTGNFMSFSFAQPQGPTSFQVSATGLDTKNRLLLTDLGIDPNTNWGFFGFSQGGNWNATSRTGQAVSTDITNVGVPEPISLFLLGCGLLGLVGAERKIKKVG